MMKNKELLKTILALNELQKHDPDKPELIVEEQLALLNKHCEAIFDEGVDQTVIAMNKKHFLKPTYKP